MEIIKKNEGHNMLATKSHSPSEINMVQARILVAQKLTRDKDKIIQSLKELFKDDLIRSFYESSDKVLFDLPRKHKGGVTYITGITIHAVKDLAGIYGHLDYGVEILKFYGKDKADCLAWCLDLQKNNCEKRQFTVHFPDRLKTVKSFSDESYKIIYSEGVRRMRSCIERILPTWLTETFKLKVQDLQNAYFKGKPEEQVKTAGKDWLKYFQEFCPELTEDDLDTMVDFAGLKPQTPEALKYMHGVLGALRMNETTIEDVCPWIAKRKKEKQDDTNKKSIDTLKQAINKTKKGNNEDADKQKSFLE